MGKKIDPDIVLEFKEQLNASMIRLDAVIELLMESDIIDRKAFYSKIQKMRNEYEEMEKNQPIEIEEPMPGDNIPGPEMELADTGHVLPRDIFLEDDCIVCNDAESANEICGPCIAQNMVVIQKKGVKDICDLPNLVFKKKKEPREAVLKGVNSLCWLYEIADKMLEAEENMLINHADIPMLMANALEQVITALGQDIRGEGIMSIVQCAVLEAQAAYDQEEGFTDDQDPGEDDSSYLDVDWQH